ncbi:hypothetical protein [Xanthomonas arboricola]|uniref:hypothetical protein n=1 Tax=Xanthomonas arboricola TaxID=56448 RepID=UPI002B28E7B0|nr:hypothetical protein X12_001579 [Xanthomonas arboricola]
MKFRVAMWVIGTLLGIPTSYHGLVWLQTKVAKQSLNCIKDLSAADYYSSSEAARAAEASFSACRDAVDAKKGTIEFLREERRRTHH